MDSMDGSTRASGLPRFGSKIATFSNGNKLQEISASETNARAGIVSAAPSYVNGVKRGTTNRKETPGNTGKECASDSNAVPEPPSKTRKASNEHTGETYAAPAGQPSKTQNGPARPASSHGRTNLGSSAVARTFGLSKGLTSSTATTTGVRAPSGGGHQRAQSAFSQSRYNPGSAPRSLAAPSTAVRTMGGSVQAAPRTSNCKDTPISYPQSLHNSRKRVGSADTVSTSSSTSAETSSRSTSWTSTTGDRSRSTSRQLERAPLGRTLSELHKIEKNKPRISSLTAKLANVSLQDEASTALVRVQTREEDKMSEESETPQPLKSSDSRLPKLSPKKVTSTSIQLGAKIDMGPPPLPLPKPEARDGSESPSKMAFSRAGSPMKKTSSPTKPVYLTKDSDIPALDVASWDQGIEGRLESMEGMFNMLKSQMDGTTFEKSATKEMMELLRTQNVELTAKQNQLLSTIDALRTQIEEERSARIAADLNTEHVKKQNEMAIEDLERRNRYNEEQLLSQHRTEIDRIRTDAADIEASLTRQHKDEVNGLNREHEQTLADFERKWRSELEDEKDSKAKVVQELTEQRLAQAQDSAADRDKQQRETDSLRTDLDRRNAELDSERSLRNTVETRLADATTQNITLESSNKAMKAKIEFLESDNQAQSHAFADLHKKTQEAIEAAEVANEKLRQEETLRRKLHNQVQELKGNIRVFCRVRPLLDDAPTDATKIKFPDSDSDNKELVVSGPETKSAMGNVSSANHAFSFDRVFGPATQNADVFDEISQLVQSALDGYNVCIFCYGQTGSGKTHTMSSADGMIPRTARQIYQTAKSLEEKGWTYKMEGSFIEVYNEQLNDLLGNAEDLDKKKHEIRHDPQRQKTTVTDITTIALDSPDRVTEVLKRADGNRSVAATKANMRSSRSHSVFILSLRGENSITGEKSEGTLNLVDLAGSERLAHSQAEGQRLKETQSINKSLSCLGDVIGALGKGEGGHVPYRNSKLTYLLQYSLGGNSKTLMFVMISPLQAHLSETLTSLKFATKVHNTHIGTAKRQSKVA